MRYFVPQITVPQEAKADSPSLGFVKRWFSPPPSQTARSSQERLGGLPLGLNLDHWPKCSECGKSQSFIAQFRHHSERLDLGREGRTLFAFQCDHDPGMCATWDAFSGANSCFVVEPEDIGDLPTALPRDAPPVEHLVLIDGWIEKDDHMSPSLIEAFSTDRTFLELSEEEIKPVTWSTRLGGLPRWIQSAEEAPKENWRFIGQLDGSYSFLKEPVPCPPWVSADSENYEGRTHVATGPNFGGGLAYLFLRDGEHRPEGCMFWQR